MIVTENETDGGESEGGRYEDAEEREEGVRQGEGEGKVEAGFLERGINFEWALFFRAVGLI